MSYVSPEERMMESHRTTERRLALSALAAASRHLEASCEHIPPFSEEATVVQEMRSQIADLGHRVERTL